MCPARPAPALRPSHVRLRTCCRPACIRAEQGESPRCSTVPARHIAARPGGGQTIWGTSLLNADCVRKPICAPFSSRLPSVLVNTIRRGEPAPGSGAPKQLCYTLATFGVGSRGPARIAQRAQACFIIAQVLADATSDTSRCLTSWHWSGGWSHTGHCNNRSAWQRSSPHNHLAQSVAHRPACCQHDIRSHGNGGTCQAKHRAWHSRLSVWVLHWLQRIAAHIRSQRAIPISACM